MYSKDIKSKFVKHLMRNGKKSVAEKLLLKNINDLQIKSIKNTSDILVLAIVNTIPYFKVRTFRVKKPGRLKRQLFELPDIIRRPNSRYSFAIKTIIRVAAKKQKSLNFLPNVLIDSAQNIGAAVEEKELLHDKIFAQTPFTTLFYRF